MKFFDPYSTIEMSETLLPHWQQPGVAFFVTFRLADSLPANLLGKWQEEREIWLKLHPPPWDEDIRLDYHRQFTVRMEQWLDAGHGSCLLRNPICSEIVGNALSFFNGKRCNQISWVVMPNHVHALFELIDHWKLEELLHSWKSWSSRQIAKQMGRNGSIWQRDYFDRIIRDTRHFRSIVRYIRKNPIKARLRNGQFMFWESEMAKAIE